MSHSDNHPLAGKTVQLTINDGGELSGQVMDVENWWDHPSVFRSSWMMADGNPAALKYAIRSATSELPIDNEVVYGKVGAFGHIVHNSELGKVMEDVK